MPSTSITPADVREYLAQLQRDFPGLRLVRKSSTGRCGPTIGTRIYVSADWDDFAPLRQYATLRHEAVHLQQYRRMGTGHSWLGVIPYLFCYLFLPLPVGFAWFRWHWECEAFLAEMQVYAQYLGADGLQARRAHYVAQFAGKGYYGWGWPWRRAVERWVDRAIGLAIYQAARAGEGG